MSKRRNEPLTHEQLLNLELSRNISEQGIKMDALLADPTLMTPEQLANLMSHYSQSGGATEFSGFTKASFPTIEVGPDTNLRDQDIFEMDSSTWGMIYMVGGTGTNPQSRLGIKYATSPKSNPHNWTKVDTLILASQETGDWTNIDGGSMVIDEDGYNILFGDFVSGKLGIATAETFGEFTIINSGDPVMDNSANTDEWNQYLRHPCWILKDGVYHAFYEARATSPNSSSVTGRKIGHATSVDKINWTHDEDPVIDPDDYPDSFLSQNVWMPDVKKIGNKYVMFFLGGVGSGSNLGCGSGFCYAVSNDLETWELKTQNFWLIPRQQSGASDDSFSTQEPAIFVENDNVHIYFNGSANDSSGFEIGYYTLTAGTFVDELPANQFEDNFDDNSIDTDKWTVSEGHGVTVTERLGKLEIAGDGSEDEAVTTVLTGKTAINSLNDGTICMTFDYDRNVNTGGDVVVGFSNAAGTNRAVIRKGGTKDSLIAQVRINGSNEYSQTIFFNHGKLKIKREGNLISFWELDDTGEWLNRTVSGSSFNGNEYFNASNWGSEDVFPIVLAENVDGSAYKAIVNDIVIKNYDYSTESPFVVSDRATEEYAAVADRFSSLTQKEQTAIQNFVTSCVAHGNWFTKDEIFVLKLNETDALTGFKLKTATNNGATKDANGYDFDGDNDYIATNFNLSTDSRKYLQNRSFLSVYIHTVGDQSTTRAVFDANDGTRTTSLFTNGTVRRARLNRGVTNAREISGVFSNDQLVTAIRRLSTASGEEIWINGVQQSPSSGATSSGLPNIGLDIGRLSGGTGFFDGVIGFLAVGSPYNHDEVAWNTDVRQLLADLS